MFTLTSYGREDLAMPAHPNRGLFWVKLQSLLNPEIRVLFATAHLPWVGSAAELSSHVNQRIPVTLRACDHLKNLINGDPLSCLIFAGDFNEDFHPLRILKDELGFVDVFEALDMPPPVTHPLRPSEPREERRPNRTLDWITFSPRQGVRVLGAFAKAVRGGVIDSETGNLSLWPPSDHAPVQAMFEFPL
jgi:endonuclease/exonuclease/phosphatase family metal-dependent hydrolase